MRSHTPSPLLRSLTTSFVLAAALLAQVAQGQTLDQSLKASAALAPDLSFPSEAREPSLFAPTGMAILKPAGNGPFPALVVHHSCGGVRSETGDWAKKAVERGYVALVMDSLGPRGLKTNCFPPNKVTVARGARDAFQAAAHLQKLPYVDPARVGLVGLSWGAVVGLLVSSPEIVPILSDGPRFAAVASLYPMCYFGGTAAFPSTFEYLRPDVDRPLLVLMGDQDNETPPKDCIPRLEALKAKNAPVEWNLYAGATHCWDCLSINGFRKVDFQGTSILYRYDAKTTEDSVRRVFDFMERSMPPRK